MQKINNGIEKGRCYFTDWLRSVACVLVLSVHSMVILQRVLKLNELEKEISNNYILILLHYGMPVFFYSSGRAFFFTNVNSGKLLMPAIIGYFTVVAAAAFLGSEWRPCSPQRPYRSIFDFYIRFFREFKCSGLEWLWTLPMIFIITIINRPYVLFLRSIRDEKKICSTRESGKELFEENTRIIKLSNENYQMLLSISFILGLVFILHFLFSFPFKQVLLPMLLCYLTLPIIIKLISGKIFSSKDSGLITSILAYIPLYIASFYIGLNLDESVSTIVSPKNKGFFLYNGMRLISEEQPLRLFFAMIFYNIYFLAGFLDHLLDTDTEMENNKFLKTLFPFKVILLVSLNAFSFPSNKSLVGYLWAYPYYLGGSTTLIFIMGTWVWLEIFRFLGITLFSNIEISKTLHKHLYQSGMVIYITHAVWIELIMRYILLYYITPDSPFSLYDGKSIRIFNYVFPGFGLFSSWIILIVSSLFLSIFTYLIIIHFKLPSLFFGINKINSFRNKIPGK